jgi:SAM-dependent methyltransferase
MQRRSERLLAGLDLATARGLEVGALTSPIVSRDGTRVLYADHADTQALRAKYANDPGVDVERIVDVDVVWADRKLADCLPPGIATLDYVVASHVIEHVPDLIGWLREAADVQRPGGRVCLVVPDKRFTFDRRRRLTDLADLVDAHLRGHRCPGPLQVFAHVADAVKVDAEAAWSADFDPSGLEHCNTRTVAFGAARVALSGKYVDVHCWVFTPRSLMTLLGQLVDLDLLPYRCAAFHETEPGSIEMLLVLERRPEPVDAREKADAEASFTARAPLAADEPPAAAGIDEAEAQALRARVAALEADSTALRTSTSWRLTAPLRYFGGLLKR